MTIFDDPILEQLEFTKGNKNWGYQLRSGLAAISDTTSNKLSRIHLLWRYGR